MPAKQTVHFSISKYPVGASTGVIGLDTARSLIPLVFRGTVGTERTNFGRLFKDIHKGSITIQKDLTLWNAYLMSELGEYNPNGEERIVFDLLYNESGKGHVCDNAVDYNNHGNLQPKKGYARAVIFTHPEGFKFNKESGLWEVIQGDGYMVHGYIPEAGFPELTNDGAYNPITGFPFSTVTREQAEASYTRRGFSLEFARMAVSKSWSREEGSGSFAVVRWCDDDGGGHFVGEAGGDPYGMSTGIGAFPVGRSPRRGGMGTGTDIPAGFQGARQGSKVKAGKS